MPDYTRREFLEGAGSVTAAALGFPSLFAQDWARQMVDKSPRRREWVKVKQGGRLINSAVAYPQTREKAPAMVVIHDIFGMSDWAEKVADEFAEAGFLAIAPDLVSGMAPNGGGTRDFPQSAPGQNPPAGGVGGTVGQAINKLPPDQITADLNAVADFCKSLPACNGKVCVVGFSWGGGQSFRFATNRKDLSAAFVFYGGGPEPAAIASIQAPVYGFYGGEDARVNAGIPQTQEQMKAAGKAFETVIYEGATHGFMKSGEQPDPTEANKKAREAAWARIKTLSPKFK
jgi:carboxymethylenebutenolidase